MLYRPPSNRSTLALERPAGHIEFRPEIGGEQAERWIEDIASWFEPEPRTLPDWPGKADLVLAPPEEGEYVAKRTSPKAGRRRATALGLLRSRSERAFACALAFERAGIITPRAVAWIEHRAEMGSTFYLVTEFEAGTGLWEACGQAAEREATLEALAQSIAALHEAELCHRDLKAPNLYGHPDGAIGFFDLESARILRTAPSRPAVVRDLGRLAASFEAGPALSSGIEEHDWKRFIERYAMLRGTSLDPKRLYRETKRYAKRKVQRNARAGRPLA